ncbi:MAG: ABC transporter ATP-binding protein, partial [Clostridia bacterium]|nr:ABC transporter ATP-binding protein [Clostridia bacterium]
MKKEKRFSIGSYLKKHAWGIFLYVFLLAIITSLQILSTILVADAIEMGTNKMLDPAIRGMINVLALTVLTISIGYLMDFLYFKVSTDIVSEMNLDLAKQAFKLNSRTYTGHGTGVFVSRIINDPQGIIDKLVGIVDR